MRKFVLALVMVTACAGLGWGNAMALTAAVIDLEVDSTLKLFKEVKGSDEVLQKAKGVLVFPSVVKAGLVLGGEFGEGALRVGGKTEGYYNTAAASLGFQAGVQKKTIIIAFMEQSALDQFRNSKGWKIGADASVAVVTLGGGGSIDTATVDKPIVGFIFDSKGLMFNITLEGAKISKITK